jgi:hypothetical protein
VPESGIGDTSLIRDLNHVLEMRALRSMIGVKLSDRVRNEMIREECGMTEDVVTKIEKNMLRWFGHVERIDEKRLTKAI